MAYCEFRVTQEEARKNAIDKFNGVPGSKQGAFAASEDPKQQLCQFGIDRGDPVFCDLPEASTDTCPIAQFAKGRITSQQLRDRLREISKDVRS